MPRRIFALTTSDRRRQTINRADLREAEAGTTIAPHPRDMRTILIIALTGTSVGAIVGLVNDKE